ncbi:BTB/POZ domain-containing protein [Pyrus ussuriensis x Pyrus communis]|uniref:BTB/POZ domain-containing protein n=1 Tax=Pyrus ussuriensis x Pyrus communis TaxID=2448454 RepID=A0A5N5H440_9ROSA|nr:BTB/POZ domain-containing protein [Pyrus ussuriensis x Pyrus communis]
MLFLPFSFLFALPVVYTFPHPCKYQFPHPKSVLAFDRTFSNSDPLDPSHSIPLHQSSFIFFINWLCNLSFHHHFQPISTFVSTRFYGRVCRASAQVITPAPLLASVGLSRCSPLVAMLLASTRASFASWRRLVRCSLEDEEAFFFINFGVLAGMSFSDGGGRRIEVIDVYFSGGGCCRRRRSSVFLCSVFVRAGLQSWLWALSIVLCWPSFCVNIVSGPLFVLAFCW